MDVQNLNALYPLRERFVISVRFINDIVDATPPNTCGSVFLTTLTQYGYSTNGYYNFPRSRVHFLLHRVSDLPERQGRPSVS